MPDKAPVCTPLLFTLHISFLFLPMCLHLKHQGRDDQDVAQQNVLTTKSLQPSDVVGSPAAEGKQYSTRLGRKLFLPSSSGWEMDSVPFGCRLFLAMIARVDYSNELCIQRHLKATHKLKLMQNEAACRWYVIRCCPAGFCLEFTVSDLNIKVELDSSSCSESGRAGP